MIDTIKLGPRLYAIASFVPNGARLGDIGTDHAYLPVYLIQKRVISKAIGIDIHKGPYKSALETVNNYGLQEKIKIRLGNGLAPLKKGEVDTLSIAGMGGTTILDILVGNQQVIQEITRLILQPQGAEARVRKELLIEGWKIFDECLVEEENRVYSIICLSKLEGLDHNEMEEKVSEFVAIFCEHIPNFDQSMVYLIQKAIWELGPINLVKKDKHLYNSIEDTINNYQKAIQEMSRTNRDEVHVHANRLKQEVLIWEGIRKWLSQ